VTPEMLNASMQTIGTAAKKIIGLINVVDELKVD